MPAAGPASRPREENLPVARPARTRGQLHVGRYLGSLALLLVALYAVVLLGGPGSKALTPKLGLDLQGGASVILSPKTDAGQPPAQSQLNTAVDIIQRRVNGLGVAEAEVVTQGPNIVVSVPGGTSSSLQSLATTAQLRFREVLDQARGGPGAAAPQPTGFPTGLPTAVPSKPGATPSRGTSPRPTGSAVVKPVPTASPRGRPVPEGLAHAAGTPQPVPPAGAAPSRAPSRAASRAASPAASRAASPAASAAAPSLAPVPSPPAGTPAPGTPPGAYTGPRSGDVYSAAAFAALDCTQQAARLGGVNDKPEQQILACADDGGTKYHLAAAPVVGTDVKGATASLDQQTGTQWQVLVNFTGEGQKKFTDLTVRTTGKQVAIVLDGLVLSAPTINERIDSQAQITGSFTQASSTSLANTLKYGALPLTFVRSETQVISPTLGKDQLGSGLLAGGLGLIAVVIYSLLYYRALGFVTIASLLVSGVLTYASVVILGKQIGFALSLAGIAGFIVAVGITADSFVVFFERLKDEIREGRTPRSAVDRSWVRARRTILSADTVSFLAAIILYFLSVGGVRGFAFTLGLSTLLDVVVVFLFTRPLLSYLSRFRWFSSTKLTGFTGPGGGAPVTGRASTRPARAPAAAMTTTEA